MSAGYPDEPGHRNVATSVEAAAMIASVSSRLRQLVLRTLWEHPAGLTSDEVCAITGKQRFSLQPRLTELRRMGLIRDTGLRRENACSGARAIVWQVVALAEKAA